MVEDRDKRIAQLDGECARMAEYVDSVTAVLMEKDPELLQEANKRRIDKATVSLYHTRPRCGPHHKSQGHPVQAEYEHGSSHTTPQQTPEVVRKHGEKPPPSILSDHKSKKWGFGKK